MPHTLYACLGSGNCFKPWLLMSQLNIPFETQLVDVLQGAQKAPEFLAINPLGVVPYLVTDTEAGIGESNAMLWFLAEGSHLMPATPEDRAEALQWMFFEQSKLEPFISPARFFTTILPQMRAERAGDIAQWQDKARLGLAQLDRHLINRAFMLASGYSIADISLFGYVHVLQEAGLEMAEYPAVADWIARVESTPQYQPLSKLGTDAQSVAA